ncbi:MAG TPA: sodium:solute symporter [Bacillota bacterium]|nr:sodium:solute symporter [Bacillota bacterium]
MKMFWKLVIVLAYLLLMGLVGFLTMKKNRTASDFFLGNRNIGPWMSAFAYGTTYFSAVIFIGYAGKIGWQFGISSLWIVLGNSLIGSFLAWKVLGRRTREMTVRLGTMTMPAFLEARFNSRKLRLLAALIIFIFLVPYSASVYMGLSYLFEQTVGIPYVLSLVFMTIITGLYLVLGGYLAISITDFLQGIVMLAGVAAMLYFGIGHEKVGGLVTGLSRLAAIDPQLARPIGPPGWLPMAGLVFLTSVGPWSLPQMVQKFYAIKSEGAIKRATVISTVFSVIIALGAYLVGSFSRLYLAEVPLVGGAANFDAIMPQVLSQALPEGLLVLILMLVLSASMSTLASLVLVASSTVVLDLLGEERLGKKKTVGWLRFFCGLFVLLSLAIALRRNTLILTLMTLSWGTVAGSFIAPYLYGLYWPRTTKAGAAAGMLSGLVVSISLALYYKFDAGLMPVIGSVAMIVPLFVVPIVSWLTEPLPKEHLVKAYGQEIYDTKLTGSEEIGG